MILTVTPNTALDQVLEVEHYVPGERLNVLAQAECIGGKGNLVSAFAADFGMDSVSLGFAAGKNGRRLAELLRRRGARADFTPVQGETRRILVVVDHKRHVQTWLVPEGLRVNRSAERDLETRVRRWLPRASWLVLCGSLPAGCSPLLYHRLTTMAHAHNVPVLIDSRGPALLRALPARPEPGDHRRRRREQRLSAAAMEAQPPSPRRRGAKKNGLSFPPRSRLAARRDRVTRSPQPCWCGESAARRGPRPCAGPSPQARRRLARRARTS